MSRKYQQRGYGEGDAGDRSKSSEPRSSRRSTTPDVPRGRGLGKPTVSVFRCGHCGVSIDLALDVEADAVCASCSADLHTCTNCKLFDSSAPAECRIPGITRVVGKARRNSCDDFERKLTQETDGGNDPDDSRAAFDALFDF